MRITDSGSSTPRIGASMRPATDWMAEAFAAAALNKDEQRMRQLIAEIGHVLARDQIASDKVLDLKRLVRRLSAATFTDPLTGLRNRWGFMRDGTRLLTVAAARRQPAVVYFFDVDRLKEVNDIAGHAAGDDVLRGAARALSATFRVSDVVARLGGDEFAAVALAGRANVAPLILQRLRQALATMNATRRSWPIKFSVGFAWFDPAAPLSLGQVLEQADGLMYQSKVMRAAATQVFERQAAAIVAQSAAPSQEPA